MAGSRRRSPILTPITTVQPEVDPGELFDVLDTCQRLGEGVLLQRADILRLAQAATQRWPGLNLKTAHTNILPFLASVAIQSPERILYDVQRAPLVQTLNALSVNVEGAS